MNSQLCRSIVGASFAVALLSQNLFGQPMRGNNQDIAIARTSANYLATALGGANQLLEDRLLELNFAKIAEFGPLENFDGGPSKSETDLRYYFHNSHNARKIIALEDGRVCGVYFNFELKISVNAVGIILTPKLSAAVLRSPYSSPYALISCDKGRDHNVNSDDLYQGLRRALGVTVGPLEGAPLIWNK